MNPIPKNRISGSVRYFGGIGTGIGIKGIVKGLEVGRFRFLKNRDSNSLVIFGTFWRNWDQNWN